MSERIAEFLELDDANRFRRLKGEDYEVVGGINLPWAVMPRILYPVVLNNEEPPELFFYDDDPEEGDDDGTQDSPRD